MNNTIRKLVTLVLSVMMLLNATVAYASIPNSEGMTADELAQAYQAARSIGTNSRLKQWYDPAIFNLSNLPEYAPKQEVSGLIRQWGSNYIEDSGLVFFWENEFKQWHPDVEFQDILTSSANAFPGLITRAADIGQMGREAVYDELNGFMRQNALGYALDVAVSNGSYNIRGWSFALGIYVNEECPIDALTMEQVDGIFGGAREGGWEGLTWRPENGRGADKNIRYWGQLGLTGEWENARIKPYGYNISYHFPREFEVYVFKGGQRWNEDMIECTNELGRTADGSIQNGGTRMMEEVSANKFAICYASQAFLLPELNLKAKNVGLIPDGQTEPVFVSYETIHDSTYPLARTIPCYVNPLKALDPVVSEFLYYLSSKQGQLQVAEDAKYIPLNKKASLEQWAKIDEAKEKGIAYFKASKTKVTFNGAEIDQGPIKGGDFVGQYIVSAKAVLDQLGGTINYDKPTYTASIQVGGKDIQVKTGNVKATVDGKAVKLAYQPILIEDSVMIPLSFITDIIGISANYDNKEDTIVIDSSVKTIAEAPAAAPAAAAEPAPAAKASFPLIPVVVTAVIAGAAGFLGGKRKKD